MATSPSTTPSAGSSLPAVSWSLRAREYQLLCELSVNVGRVVTHDEFLRRIWGAKKPDNLRALRAHLRRIRSQIGEDASNPVYFFAEPRVGCRVPKGECQATP